MTYQNNPDSAAQGGLSVVPALHPTGRDGGSFVPPKLSVGPINLTSLPEKPAATAMTPCSGATSAGTQVDIEPDTSVEEPESCAADDSRGVVAYLLAPESDEYIAIMGVLESSSADLVPAELTAALLERGTSLDPRVMETRLEQLRAWGAVSGRSDQTHVRRVHDLLRRNFRYSATRVGRQAQRFYQTVLANTQVMREIPLQSLNAVVLALEVLSRISAGGGAEEICARVNDVFVAHDNLDSSLIGAEDVLMGLADRFDLDDSLTSELKSLLVNYASRVAIELDRGADRAWRALAALAPSFDVLARMTVERSAAADLIGRDLLSASKGGDVGDWQGLMAWFDPMTGRSARFNSRMVLAIPTFHANLRRLHTAGESGTSRSRALLLARACLNEEFGAQLFVAALGDHSWRKFHGEAEDLGAGRTPPWRDGPKVPVPLGLRTHGRAGVRGRAPAPVDDGPARKAVELARQQRQVRHRQYLREILSTERGDMLSDGAARVAFEVLRLALRGKSVGGKRHATQDGLACSVFWTGSTSWLLRAPMWRVLLPGRECVFHAPNTVAATPAGVGADPNGYAEFRIVQGGVA